MTSKICKGHHETEEVAHYVIAEFMEHSRAEELIERGEAMKFMSGMIWRSFHSKTSPYHKTYRQNNRMGSLEEWHEPEVVDYDFDTDVMIEAIQDILDEMQLDTTEMWYRSRLFSMWLTDKNYSSLSKKTGIPRTSISQAVNETREYIKQQLKERNIDYEL